MEQNPPVLAKKVWRMARVVYFLLKKSISKKKLLLDLNMMVKRGKIAGKAFQNQMFHHHHHSHRSNDTHHLSFPSPLPGDYEFSCTNTPSANNNQTFSLFSTHKNKNQSNNKPSEDLDIMEINAAVWKAMEMIHSETASPALPGFGRSPMVRQLRVTDSPFLLSSMDEDSHVVDEAAEKFITRFYNDLRRQNTNAASFGSS